MPENQENKSETSVLTFTAFKHKTICDEFNYLLGTGYTVQMVMNMVGWKHEITAESAYNIYRRMSKENQNPITDCSIA